MKSEYLEHIEVASWLRVRGVPFHHSPNETYTTSHAQKAMNKRKGVSPGFPDFIIFFPKRLVFMELKRAQGGRVSPEQLRWETVIRSSGHAYELCRGAHAAIAALEQYLGEETCRSVG